MTYPEFGMNITNIREQLLELAERVRGLKGYEPQLVLREFYEETYGIVNPKSTSPLALVAMSNGDTLHELMPWYQRLNDWRILEIGNHWKITWSEFIHFPRSTVLYILETTRDELADKQSRASKMQNDIDREAQRAEAQTKQQRG